MKNTKPKLTARSLVETPIQEVTRMRLMMAHFRKLTMPSRSFAMWLMEKYAKDQLPEAKQQISNNQPTKHDN